MLQGACKLTIPKEFEKTLTVLSFTFLFSIVLTSFIILAGISNFTQIDNQTMEIIIFLVALMFAIIIYNLIINGIIIIGWFKKKQYNREYHKVIDRDIFSCHVKRESFLCDEKFRFCPVCGMKINEVSLN